MANPTPKQDETPSVSAEHEGTENPAAVSENPTPRSRSKLPTEVGGPQGLEPTRYGDWERNGRCTDF